MWTSLDIQCLKTMLTCLLFSKSMGTLPKEFSLVVLQGNIFLNCPVAFKQHSAQLCGHSFCRKDSAMEGSHLGFDQDWLCYAVVNGSSPLMLGFKI